MKTKARDKQYILKGKLLRRPGRGEPELERGVAALGLRYTRQASVGPYFADFYLDEYRLVLEVDGKDHKRPAKAEKDGRRDAFMRSQGYRVVRVEADRARANPRGVALFALKQALVPAEFTAYKERRAKDLAELATY